MQLPSARTARVDILVEGSLTSTGGGVASSCTLIRDGERAIVVDPGMAAERRRDPRAARGARGAARGGHRRRAQPSPPRPHDPRRPLPERRRPRSLGDLSRHGLGGLRVRRAGADAVGPCWRARRATPRRTSRSSPARPRGSSCARTRGSTPIDAVEDEDPEDAEALHASRRRDPRGRRPDRAGPRPGVRADGGDPALTIRRLAAYGSR